MLDGVIWFGMFEGGLYCMDCDGMIICYMFEWYNLCSLFFVLVGNLVIMLDGILWVGIKVGLVCWIGYDFECVFDVLLLLVMINGFIFEFDGSLWININVGVVV